jgi:hypothetical protein
MKNDDPKTLTLNLHVSKKGRPPLREYLDAAAEALFQKTHHVAPLDVREKRRLVEMAIIAFCEMVIRDGGVVMPLVLKQSGNNGASSDTPADRFRHARN